MVARPPATARPGPARDGGVCRRRRPRTEPAFPPGVARHGDRLPCRPGGRGLRAFTRRHDHAAPFRARRIRGGGNALTQERRPASVRISSATRSGRPCRRGIARRHPSSKRPSGRVRPDRMAPMTAPGVERWRLVETIQATLARHVQRPPWSSVSRHLAAMPDVAAGAGTAPASASAERRIRLIMLRKSVSGPLFRQSNVEAPRSCRKRTFGCMPISGTPSSS